MGSCERSKSGSDPHPQKSGRARDSDNSPNLKVPLVAGTTDVSREWEWEVDSVCMGVSFFVRPRLIARAEDGAKELLMTEGDSEMRAKLPDAARASAI
jgi:hypothetical protein